MRFLAPVALAVMVFAAPCCCVMFLSATVFAGDKTAAEAQQELQGEWQIVSIVANGKPVEPDNEVATIGLNTVTFAGDQVGYKIDKRLRDPYTLAPAEDPRQITVTQVRGKLTCQVRGIYKPEGDTLTICVDPSLKERPTAFASKKGSAWRLSVYRRVKP